MNVSDFSFSYFSPFSASGGAYAGDSNSSLGCVLWLIVTPCGVLLCSLIDPKSPTYTSPFGSTNMFPGFMSRWITPSVCSVDTPCAAFIIRSSLLSSVSCVISSSGLMFTNWDIVIRLSLLLYSVHSMFGLMYPASAISLPVLSAVGIALIASLMTDFPLGNLDFSFSIILPLSFFCALRFIPLYFFAAAGLNPCFMLSKPFPLSSAISCAFTARITSSGILSQSIIEGCTIPSPPSPTGTSDVLRTNGSYPFTWTYGFPSVHTVLLFRSSA